MHENIWPKRVLEWKSLEKRKKGRPTTRWKYMRIGMEEQNLLESA